MLQVGTHRQARRQAGHLQAVAHAIGQKERRGLSAHGGVGGDHQLGDAITFNPLVEFDDPQILGIHSVNGRERPAQYVVPPAELMGALNRHDGRGLLHHADDC